MTTGRHEHNVHEQWDELAVGYALSALEPEELDRFVQHLIGQCAECNRSVSDTNTVGAGLAAAFPVPQPRESLRDDVLAAAFAARPAVPQTSADLPTPITAFRPEPASEWADPASFRATPSGADHRSVDADESAVDELAERRAGRRRTGRGKTARVSWVLAAAAAVVAVVMSAVAVSAVHSRNDQRSVAAGRAQVIAAFTSGGSAQVVALRTDGGSMVATVVAHKDSVAVVPAGMEANSKSTSYVLWGIASATSAPVALGVFDVDGAGEQATQVGSDSRGYAGFTTFAISHEPGHTPPASPSTIIATGQI
ncbi:MAG: uncharacterized protein JWM76_4767 [Pseudonocardiales bacterium]|nr:uncharacterized protein [Pseudonocardiales bacterium]